MSDLLQVIGLDDDGLGQVEVAGDKRSHTVQVRWIYAGPRSRVGEITHLAPGPNRRPDPCGYRPACGGCPIEPVDDGFAHAWKRQRALSRIDGLAGVLDPHGAATGRGRWRRRQKFLVVRSRGEARLMVPGPRRAPPLAIPDCPILPTALRNRLVQLETQLTDPALTSVHAIVLTAGIDGEPDLAAVGIGLIGEDPCPDRRPPVGAPGDAVAWRHSKRSRQLLSTTGAPDHYSGPNAVACPVGALILPTPPFAFLQAHPGQSNLLRETVLEFAPERQPGDLAVDSGTGTGLFARSLAAQGWSVLAIEASPAAEPAWEQPVAGVTFLRQRADAADWPAGPRLVVCDPPRAGLGADWARCLLAAEPEHIIILHCGLAAAARDLQSLRESGYALTAARVVDLFPGTPQVELVTAWRRQN
jgi:tRNA/tmRNA/rRNA uracil-C5-methylase (TrmA/RlmC/RlmD family)